MASLLGALLSVVKVAVISGGTWSQFEQQVISRLPTDACLAGLSLLPTCGTTFYHYDSTWKQLYAENLSEAEKAKIIQALNDATTHPGFKAEQTWGDRMDDRGTQITYSALGQHAPLEAKRIWDPDFIKREKIKAVLDHLIPEFSVRLGGMTSVDVTRQGIDKGYGMGKLRDLLGIPMNEMIYVGDALFPNGNDYPARQPGVSAIQVRDPHETKRVIETASACLGVTKLQMEDWVNDN